MSATLATRAAALHSRLKALDLAASNIAEVNALEGLRAGLAGRAEKLGAELAKMKLLADSNIIVTPPTALVAAQKRATGLLEKFERETKAAILKRGQGWNGLLAEVDAAGRELASAVISAWKGHRQSVFAGETPAQIRGKLARTPANDDAFERYEQLYSRLRLAFDALPADAAAIAAASKIAAELEKAAKAFDFNVPADVKQFLEAVLSVRGAPLSLLTPSVLDWLEKNGGLDSYAVRATGR